MKINDFEKKIEKSKEILDKLMDPEITLEDSMKLYKEGIKELKEASKMLENAKLEFEELSKTDEDAS
jgi:exodeoxyribonuclease VII small subunit